MSDQVQIVLIGIVPAVLTAIGGIITAVSLFRKVDRYHDQVNGKMNQLLEVTGNAREAEGKEKQRLSQEANPQPGPPAGREP